MKRKTVPAKNRVKLVRLKKPLTRPSQITKAKPTKRLVKRRKANVKPGYFPNPKKRPLDGWNHIISCTLSNGSKKVLIKVQNSSFAKALVDVLNQHAPHGVHYDQEK